MKEFSREEIDTWRKKFISRGYPQKQAHLDERVVDYFVMPKERFRLTLESPLIPNGLYRMTGKPEDGYLVGVSEEVPEIIQPHFAMSEHDEFMVYGLGDKDRTLHSEQNIIRILDSSELQPTYITNKITLYDFLIDISREDPAQYGFTLQDYDGFVRANEYLKSVL